MPLGIDAPDSLISLLFFLFFLSLFLFRHCLGQGAAEALVVNLLVVGRGQHAVQQGVLGPMLYNFLLWQENVTVNAAAIWKRLVLGCQFFTAGWLFQKTGWLFLKAFIAISDIYKTFITLHFLTAPVAGFKNFGRQKKSFISLVPGRGELRTS